MKSNKWLDGKQQDHWPITQHIGWVVCTAGWVDLDLEPQNISYNCGKQRLLPPGTRMILKDIKEGYAFTYNNNGVMMMPVEVLEPWTR